MTWQKVSERWTVEIQEHRKFGVFQFLICGSSEPGHLLNYSATSRNSAEPQCFLRGCKVDSLSFAVSSVKFSIPLLVLFLCARELACACLHMNVCVCSCTCAHACEWMCRHKHGDQRSKLVVFSIAFHAIICYRVSHWLQSHWFFNLSCWARPWDPPVSASAVLRPSARASVAGSLYGYQGSELESSCLQSVYWLRHFSSLPLPPVKQGMKEKR